MIPKVELFKTRAAHFPVQRDKRTGMERAILGKSGSEGYQDYFPATVW